MNGDNNDSVTVNDLPLSFHVKYLGKKIARIPMNYIFAKLLIRKK